MTEQATLLRVIGRDASPPSERRTAAAAAAAATRRRSAWRARAAGAPAAGGGAASCERYAVLHALLASLPHAAVVTTNSDLCYDAACAAAGVSLNVLPYDTRPSERWLLKLHGDVHHPEDIVLTYSSGAPYGADREALSGLVQALLITKHMLFVGFSLRDTSFNQVATTVRRALGAADDAEEEPSAAPQAFGSAITLSERPFLAELWPDLESIPVAPASHRADRAAADLVLLDRVCLIVAGAEHVLAPTPRHAHRRRQRAAEELESLAGAARRAAPRRRRLRGGRACSSSSATRAAEAEYRCLFKEEEVEGNPHSPPYR